MAQVTIADYTSSEVSEIAKSDFGGDLAKLRASADRLFLPVISARVTRVLQIALN